MQHQKIYSLVDRNQRKRYPQASTKGILLEYRIYQSIIAHHAIISLHLE